MENNLFAKFLRQVNKKSNNKGSSVVLVIVAIAFVGMLVAMSSFMSYYNWLAKSNDKQSKTNFYTAEEALAEIKAGLQNVVANAMSMSYSYALQNNTGASLSEREVSFQVMYEKQLIEQLKGVDLGHYNVDILTGYLKKTKWQDATQTGAKLLTLNNAGENVIFKKNGGIVLQNVKIMYADQRGYVTYITTDIFLQLPKISLVAAVGVPEIENCSIIANKTLDVTNNNNIKISGHVYGGKEGMLASGDTTLSFVKKDTDPASAMYRLVASSITVENSNKGNVMNVSENYDVWTEQIFVESGNLSLKGSSFVRDDLTIDGKNSNVTVWGSYYGYGDELYKSTNSSSILINGGNTNLDFSRLDNLMLSGHAYVGARHYDPNLTTDEDYVADPDAEPEEGEGTPSVTPTYKQNNKDLMMGESIGVKSNQLIYMVPTECMGYYAGTSEQFLAKNPMSYSEYLTLTTTYQYELNDDGTVKKDSAGNPIYKLDSDGNKMLQYDEVNLGIIAKKIGKNLNSLGATYKPIFRKINGSVLVYYYLDFTSDQAANEFFRLYYKNDKANMDSYIKMYISDLKLNDSLNVSNANLHLAGNAIKFNAAGEVSLVEDTVEEDLTVEDSLDQNREKWFDAYTAYSKKMLSSTSFLTSRQLNNDIYTNLVVDDVTFANIVTGGTTRVFENGAVKALAINNKNTGEKTLNFADLNGVNLVIASGDIVLNTNFNGLILSGGVVKLGPQCNTVTSDSIATRKAIAAVSEDGNFKMADLLLDGAAYISQVSAAGASLSNNDLENKIDREQDYIKLGDLIAYENWTKH